MVDEELLPTRPFTPRLGVWQLYIDEPVWPQDARGPRKHRDWIDHVLENLVEAHRVVLAKVFEPHEVATYGAHADVLPGVVAAPRVRIDGRAVPTRLFHAMQEDTQARAHIEDRAASLARAGEGEQASNASGVVAPLERQGIDAVEVAFQAIEIPVVRVDVLPCIKKRQVHLMLRHDVSAGLAPQQVPTVGPVANPLEAHFARGGRDRKSTRLNSSHQ